jgi:CO dehydrogenase maturation factor
MKLAVSGKGGVGKTTFTSLLCSALAASGREVLAVDADPSPCLGNALGFPQALLEGITPLAQMQDFIAGRMQTLPDGASYMVLNPRVEDIPDRFSVVHQGIRLLMLGAVEQGGAGCICSESTLLRRLVSHLLLERQQVVVLDMYAGVEHLGRATADGVDAMLIVVEPTQRSLTAADQIRSLAEQIGLRKVLLVGNKVRGERDATLIRAHAPAIRLLGTLSLDEAVNEADWQGHCVADASPRLKAEAQSILDALLSELSPGKM